MNFCHKDTKARRSTKADYNFQYIIFIAPLSRGRGIGGEVEFANYFTCDFRRFYVPSKHLVFSPKCFLFYVIVVSQERLVRNNYEFTNWFHAKYARVQRRNEFLPQRHEGTKKH